MNEETVHTSKSWLAAVMLEMFRSIHNQEPDNFDESRYSEAHRHAFFYDAHARFLAYLTENVSAFHTSRGLLEDQTSHRPILTGSSLY